MHRYTDCLPMLYLACVTLLLKLNSYFSFCYKINAFAVKLASYMMGHHNAYKLHLAFSVLLPIPLGSYSFGLLRLHLSIYSYPYCTLKNPFRVTVSWKSLNWHTKSDTNQNNKPEQQTAIFIICFNTFYQFLHTNIL